MASMVLKYTTDWADEVKIALPESASILHFGTQEGRPTFWALVEDDGAIPEVRKIRITGTGHPIDQEHMNYIGTTTVDTGFETLVFHAFEIL